MGAVPAALPANEEARLAALQSYRVLDTPPEAEYDDIVRIASEICGTGMAVMTLVARDRQWFKAKTGITGIGTHRDESFCAHAILEHGVFEVPDTLEDPRFRGNPSVVGDPHIRFYAGAPLVDDSGAALGTLCVVDRAARTLTPGQREALAALSRLVMAKLKLRAAHLTLEETLLGVDPKSREIAASTRRSVTNHLAHQLATPLTPMLLQVYALRMRTTDAASLGSIDVLERNLKRLEAAIAEVLAFTAGRGLPPPPA